MLLKFVDRRSELDGLNEMYEKEGSALLILYGRRRIGKTTLAKKFAEDKPNFYFLARRQDFSLELKRMREEFSEQHDVFIPKPRDLDELFDDMLEKIDQKNKFVFIIDEFPYWIEENKEILSEMQHLWDEKLQDKNIFLILTGSSIGMMESEVLNRKSPLYGRRTGQLKLTEIPLKNINDFLPNYSKEDLIRTYGAVGGVPFYLKEFNDEKGFYENVKATFLNRLNILHEEAEILLREELRKPNVYFNIIKAIIDGSTKTNEISNQSKVSITNVTKYLKVLERLKIIKREHPITEPAKKKNFHYRVIDSYFRFWLSFVYPYQGKIEDDPDKILENVRSEYDRYMGPVFEEVCKNYVRKNLDYEDVGRWWFRENEIDIVGLNEKESRVLFGECKWTNEEVGPRELEHLRGKVEKVRWKNDQRDEKFALFSRSGFSEELKDQENLMLVELEEMI
ncbi:MAG: ATP-binding protein [Candidatus Thermoplasmatota archaeon]